MQNLADAASLEEALETEEMELIDLDQLIRNYVANCSLVHNQYQFDYRGSKQPAFTLVSDFRIEQLLDKIIDNAIDFHRRDSPNPCSIGRLQPADTADRRQSWTTATCGH